MARAGNLRRDADEEDERPDRVEGRNRARQNRSARRAQRTADRQSRSKSVANWIERDESQRAAESARLAEIRAKERAELEAARGQAARAASRERTAEARARRRDLRWSRWRKTTISINVSRRSRNAWKRERGAPLLRPRPQSHDELARCASRSAKTADGGEGSARDPCGRPLSDTKSSLRTEIAAMRKSLADLRRRATPASRSKARCSTSDSDSTRRAATTLNTEALKPIEDMLHEVLDALRRQNPQPAAVGVARDLGALNQKIDALAWTSVEPELLDQIRRQTEDIRRQARRRRLAFGAVDAHRAQGRATRRPRRATGDQSGSRKRKSTPWSRALNETRAQDRARNAAVRPRFDRAAPRGADFAHR